MGIQIHIEVQDLLQAGWKLSITKSVGDSYLTIEKDNYIFHSYFTDVFVADCNDWGSNKQKFKEAGLLDIPHIFTKVISLY